MIRTEANDAAKRVVTILSANPEAGAFVRDGVTGFRVVPEEIWIESINQWVRLSDMAIKPLGRPHLYPGIWTTWAMRRFFRWWRDQVPVPPACDHHYQSDVHWSENGYVSMCKMCRKVVYHGD